MLIVLAIGGSICVSVFLAAEECERTWDFRLRSSSIVDIAFWFGFIYGSLALVSFGDIDDSYF